MDLFIFMTKQKGDTTKNMKNKTYHEELNRFLKEASNEMMTQDMSFNCLMGAISAELANIADELRMIREKMEEPESKRTFVELVVRYPDPEVCLYEEYKGKPYYCIKYIENGETHVGYGTYNPEVLSQYLKEFFISSAQSEPTVIEAESE